MTTYDALPPGIVRRAATIARGPHACPTCECPTWAEPPIPWTDLRDYVVRCDACERPIAIRVDRDRILRRGAVPRHLREQGTDAAVAELLDTRGRRAFALRLAAALTLPVLLAVIALAAGSGIPIALTWAMLAIVPGALWAPALAASAASKLAAAWRRLIGTARTAAHIGPRQETTIDVAAGRWDQWIREEKLRSRDRIEHPDAVLQELERVLEDRELRRVRALAERGDVPAEHLEDLLRFRRSWQRPEHEVPSSALFG
jgi:hypothetical protein